MRTLRHIHAVDSHTEGEATRVVIGGIPKIPGETMPDKRAFLETEMDNLRTAIMHEPRGHNDMFGSVITQPCSADADFGVIFMDGGGYLNMCGHGAIGAITVAVETGMVFVEEPVTRVTIDTPSGLVSAEVEVADGLAKRVTIVNVPSFLYRKDVSLELPDVGSITFDIAFGGSFFAIVSAEQFGVSVKAKNVQPLVARALQLRDLINETIEIQHPTLPHIKTVDLVEVFDRASAAEAHYKNVVVFGKQQVDRSPCGTGTSAKLATLHARGKLEVGQPFIYESILGTLFEGKILETTKVGELDAVIPQITGAAYITGFNHFVLDPNDPLKYGFIL